MESVSLQSTVRIWGLKWGPPNFVIEKQTRVHFILFCVKKKYCRRRNDEGESWFEIYFTVKKNLKYPSKLLRPRHFVVFRNHRTRVAK